MTSPTPPPLPDFPPPPPQPKKSRTNLIIIASAAAVIAAIVGTGIVVAQSRDGGGKPAAASKSSAPAAKAAAEPDPSPTYEVLDKDSFVMTLKTTKRQCFGSAGCNVTVEPELSYVGAGDIDPDATYDITYKIHGDESGPVIETAELSDESNLSYTPSLIQTASSSTKVTVDITDVTEEGA
jgi:hypothetical protein